MGIYVHVPFCRSKCFYCGFYSIASIRLKEDFIRALCREMELRRDYVPVKTVDTLYFGGGTPSCLTPEETGKIVRKLEDIYQFVPGAERTIEMNPEDCTIEKLKKLKDLKFNRISIGVQSFNDNILKQINRSHSAEQAVRAVTCAAVAGFDNVSIDLIIGLPGYTIEDLKKDIDILSNLPISHISVYILSIDSNSIFEKLVQKGKFLPDEDDLLAERWQMVSEHLQSIGFEHYEISNFAKDGKYSIHNTSYWQQKAYVGFGPSAHSYDIDSRQWNVANLNEYIESLDKSLLKFDKEMLSTEDKYNEYIMTNFRTMWGADLNVLRSQYKKYWESVSSEFESYFNLGYIQKQDNRLRLTEKGWLISDRIFSDLFSNGL